MHAPGGMPSRPPCAGCWRAGSKSLRHGGRHWRRSRTRWSASRGPPMARTKYSANAPKTFSDLPGPPIGTLLANKQDHMTFWHGSERACLAAIWREYIENDRQAWMVRHYFYVLGNAGLLKTDVNRYPTSEQKA